MKGKTAGEQLKRLLFSKQRHNLRQNLRAKSVKTLSDMRTISQIMESANFQKLEEE
jgi:hypothetical protein